MILLIMKRLEIEINKSILLLQAHQSINLLLLIKIVEYFLLYILLCFNEWFVQNLKFIQEEASIKGCTGSLWKVAIA